VVQRSGGISLIVGACGTQSRLKHFEGAKFPVDVAPLTEKAIAAQRAPVVRVIGVAGIVRPQRNRRASETR
jgi:hypothetical protein